MPSIPATASPLPSIPTDESQTENTTARTWQLATYLTKQIQDAFAKLSEQEQKSDDARTTKLNPVMEAVINELMTELEEENDVHITEKEQKIKAHMATKISALKQAVRALGGNDAADALITEYTIEMAQETGAIFTTWKQELDAMVVMMAMGLKQEVKDVIMGMNDAIDVSELEQRFGAVIEQVLRGQSTTTREE